MSGRGRRDRREIGLWYTPEMCEIDATRRNESELEYGACKARNFSYKSPKWSI